MAVADGPVSKWGQSICNHQENIYGSFGIYTCQDCPNVNEFIDPIHASMFNESTECYRSIAGQLVNNRHRLIIQLLVLCLYGIMPHSINITSVPWLVYAYITTIYDELR